jgi:hypothetical protein
MFEKESLMVALFARQKSSLPLEMSVISNSTKEKELCKLMLVL